jgi:hypothetical protein
MLRKHLNFLRSIHCGNDNLYLDVTDEQGDVVLLGTINC